MENLYNIVNGVMSCNGMFRGPVTQDEINGLLTIYPGTPNKKRDISAAREWAIWRAITNRIITNRHYRYSDNKRFLLLKLAEFARQQYTSACDRSYPR